MNFILYEMLPLVLNMSLIGSTTIAVVLCCRLLMKKAPKVFSYILWSIVLFRLLCPFAIQTNFSFIGIFNPPTTVAGLIEYIPQDIVHTENPRVQIPLPMINDIINENLTQGEEQLVADPLEAPVSFATVGWLTGIAVMLIFAMIQLIKLKSKLVGATPLRDNIYIADHISSPFVMGFIKPKIYLPSSMAESEQNFIILHEQCHIKRFDHITRILAFVALTIHWFNPLVWLAFILSGKDMEMSCDEAVMKRMDTDIRAEYSRSLLRFATGKKLIFSTPLAFGEGDTKARVKNVMSYKKPILWVSALALVMIGIVAVGLLSNPAGSQGKIAMNDAIFLESRDIIYELPTETTQIGILESVVLRTTALPDTPFSATNLDPKYAGNPLFQDNNDNTKIYLYDYEGFYIPFQITDDGFAANPNVDRHFAMTGVNLSDLQPLEITQSIGEIVGKDYSKLALTPDNFGLIVSTDFSYIESEAIRFLYDIGKENCKAAQLRIFPTEADFFVTEPNNNWVAPKEPVFKLYSYLEALKYLPQEEIAALCTTPPQRYAIELSANDREYNDGRQIFYSKDGITENSDWNICLDIHPLYEAGGSFNGVGNDIIHVYYTASL